MRARLKARPEVITAAVFAGFSTLYPGQRRCRGSGFALIEAGALFAACSPGGG